MQQGGQEKNKFAGLEKRNNAGVIKPPKLLLIYGEPKTGKSSFLSMLPDTLLVDFQSEFDYVDEGLVAKIATPQDFNALVQALKKESKKFKRIVLDNTTHILEMLKPSIVAFFKRTSFAQGVNPLTNRKYAESADLTFDSIPSPHNWVCQRPVFLKLVDIMNAYCETLIVVSHMKTASSYGEAVGGKNLVSFEPDIPGQLKNRLCGLADAIGVFSIKGKRNYIDFEGNGLSIAQARCQHLRGKTILIGESRENNKLISHWEEIFPDIKSNNNA